MRSFVIAIIKHSGSMECAERCIRSGRFYGLDIEVFPAITPKDNVTELLRQEGIRHEGFVDKISRTDNAIACFLSHYFLWQKCVRLGEKINIFEHDAVLLDSIPDCDYKHATNWGMPSYGKWKEPKLVGINKLTTKRYFPGTHAYGVTPEGAKLLIDKAPEHAQTPDLYLHLDNFPDLQEHYPFIAEARDTFTTVQTSNGQRAKNNYTDAYQYVAPG